MVVLTPTSPGTLTSVPTMMNRAKPNASVSPTWAFSAMRSDGSTTATRPSWMRDHALAGLVMISP